MATASPSRTNSATASCIVAILLTPSPYNGPALLVHVQRERVQSADALAAGAAAFPAAEDLHTRPGARRSAGRPVDVGSAGPDVLEEPVNLLAKKAGGQA